MKTVRTYHLPEDKQKKLGRAKRLEWWTIFFLTTITIVIYLAMGSSQAMKAAWIEDVLSLVPPIVFLTAVHFRTKPPNARFPYGYRRAVLIAFLAAATALFMLGAYMLYDSAMALIRMEHPTIGTVDIFGWQIWFGWLMIAALVYSAIPPVILGRMKLPLAHELHEKVLYADADMNKADWATAVAAIIGIVGIGLGWWWADAVAAGFISLDVLKDGIVNLKEAITDLMDQRPTRVGSEEKEEVVDQVREKLRALAWVEDADVRLREVGDVFQGEAYLVPKDKHDSHLLEKLRQANDLVDSISWKVHDITLTPVESLEQETVAEEKKVSKL